MKKSSVRIPLALGSFVALSLSLGACFVENPKYEPPADSASSVGATTSDSSTASSFGGSSGAGSTGDETTGVITTSATSSMTSGMTAVMTVGSTFPFTSGSSFTSTSGGGSSTGAFPDGCDPYEQDCFDGTKCTAMDSDADGYLDELTCALYGDEILGEMCFVNLETGDDTCGPGLACVKGTCRELCSGSEDDPLCLQGDAECFLYKDILPICLPKCVPPGYDECDGGVCVPSPNSNGFVCAPAGLNNGIGEGCEHVNDCKVALFCAPMEDAPLCNAGSCCTPYCNNDEDPIFCDAYDLSCQSFNNPMFPNVGFCGVE